MTNEQLKFFTNCIVTKGKYRVSIVDLQRNLLVFIPIELAFLFDNEIKKSWYNEIQTSLNDEERIIAKWISFFISQEFAHWTQNPECFPELGLDYHYPGLISNAIIEADLLENYYFLNLFRELESIGCKYIELRYYSVCDLLTLEALMLESTESRIRSVTVYLPYNIYKLNEKEICRYDNGRFTFIIHSAQEFATNEPSSLNVSFVTTTLNRKCCGEISEKSLIPNLYGYLEGVSKNNCLNLKVSVDIEGNIKNCPSMTKVFGNIRTNKLFEVVTSNNFTKIWSISKNKIKECNNCELRSICTDCRAYIENPEDIYSKPLKCGYNQRTGEWDEWSTNPLKQKAIKYYGMEEIINKG